MSSYNMDEKIKRQYYLEMNEYFNNLKKCDQEHAHGGECCYLGTPKERYEKFNEIKERHERNDKLKKYKKGKKPISV